MTSIKSTNTPSDTIGVYTTTFQPNWEVDPMTLVVGLPGVDFVVVAADTLLIRGTPGAWYSTFAHKFEKLGKNCVIGIAGREEAKTFLDLSKHGLDFENPSKLVTSAQELAGRIYARYQKTEWGQEKPVMTFLICGFDEDGPAVYDFGPPTFVPTLKDVGAIGESIHGALYFVYSHWDRDMTVEQLALLAYFSVRETGRHDSAVGDSPELAVVTKDDVKIFSSSQLKALAERCNEISALITAEFQKPGPTIRLD